LKPKRIGVYSGSFDPVHEGHIAFASEAIRQAGLQKVFFLVEPRPRYKQGVKAFEHRSEMVRLAISGHPDLGMIVLEQSRFDVLQTWPQLQARFKGAELYMLMGDDVFNRLSHWPRVDRLITSAHFIVGLRKFSEAEAREHLAMIEKTRAIDLRYDVFRPSKHQYSSQAIRAGLRKGRLPDGLDPSVVEYIREHKLYTSTLIS
jgi:nicotinate-nucleotide adenylyltransferase